MSDISEKARSTLQMDPEKGVSVIRAHLDPRLDDRIEDLISDANLDKALLKLDDFTAHLSKLENLEDFFADDIPLKSSVPELGGDKARTAWPEAPTELSGASAAAPAPDAAALSVELDPSAVDKSAEVVQRDDHPVPEEESVTTAVTDMREETTDRPEPLEEPLQAGPAPAQRRITLAFPAADLDFDKVLDGLETQTESGFDSALDGTAERVEAVPGADGDTGSEDAPQAPQEAVRALNPVSDALEAAAEATEPLPAPEEDDDLHRVAPPHKVDPWSGSDAQEEGEDDPLDAQGAPAATYGLPEPTPYGADDGLEDYFSAPSRTDLRAESEGEEYALEDLFKTADPAVTATGAEAGSGDPSSRGQTGAALDAFDDLFPAEAATAPGSVMAVADFDDDVPAFARNSVRTPAEDDRDVLPDAFDEDAEADWSAPDEQRRPVVAASDSDRTDAKDHAVAGNDMPASYVEPGLEKTDYSDVWKQSQDHLEEVAARSQPDLAGLSRAMEQEPIDMIGMTAEPVRDRASGRSAPREAGVFQDMMEDRVQDGDTLSRNAAADRDLDADDDFGPEDDLGGAAAGQPAEAVPAPVKRKPSMLVLAGAAVGVMAVAVAGVASIGPLLMGPSDVVGMAEAPQRTTPDAADAMSLDMAEQDAAAGGNVAPEDALPGATAVDPDGAPAAGGEAVDAGLAATGTGDVPSGDLPEGLSDLAAGLSTAAQNDMSDLFLDPAAESAAVDPAVAEEAVKQVEERMKEALSVLDDRLTRASVQQEETTATLTAMADQLSQASARAAAAEQLALAQNEVLVDIVRLQDQMRTAESLVVDLSQRIAEIEAVEPADRSEVEQQFSDISARLDALSRDMGLIARMTLGSGQAEGPLPVVAEEAPVPGSPSVYDRAEGGVGAVPGPAKVPSDVAIGDHVEGYGTVLDIVPTSDGSRLVVMENGSVLIK